MIEKVVKEERMDSMGKWVIYEDLTMKLVEESPQWIARKKEIEEEAKTPVPPTEVELLKIENAKLKQEDLNNKEAILELYMIAMGGF